MTEQAATAANIELPAFPRHVTFVLVVEKLNMRTSGVHIQDYWTNSFLQPGPELHFGRARNLVNGFLELMIVTVCMQTVLLWKNICMQLQMEHLDLSFKFDGNYVAIFSRNGWFPGHLLSQ